MYDVAIVGGGCLGCAVGKALVERHDLEVCILEKEHQLASHQSGRNSGVLHPGFNYQPGSTKAQFATTGTTRLKRYCAERSIPIAEGGITLVAMDETERERLRTIRRQARENDVPVEWLDDEDAIRSHEPHASGIAGLFAPTGATIDAQQYVHELARDVTAGGGTVLLDHTVETVTRARNRFQVETEQGTVTAERLVNAAGLYADRLAEQLDVDPPGRIVPFRGEYYELATDRRSLVNSMVYPTPKPDLPFLGVHFTRRPDGRVLVGPNAVLAPGREAYHDRAFDLRELLETITFPGFVRLCLQPSMRRHIVSELRTSLDADAFFRAANRLIDDLDPDDLTPSYAGIRAQFVGRDGRLVQQPVVRSDGAAIHVLNAVSPGLTSSLVLGEHVARRLTEHHP